MLQGPWGPPGSHFGGGLERSCRPDSSQAWAFQGGRWWINDLGTYLSLSLPMNASITTVVYRCLFWMPLFTLCLAPRPESSLTLHRTLLCLFCRCSFFVLFCFLQLFTQSLKSQKVRSAYWKFCIFSPYSEGSNHTDTIFLIALYSLWNSTRCNWSLSLSYEICKLRTEP